MSAPLIRIEGLHKDYFTGAGRVPALNGVDLEIRAGEFVTVMGPSGSGKSTFMNILGCLDSATRGRYLFEGEDVARLDADRLAAMRNRALGFVFQGSNLLARMDALDNVALPLVYAGVERTARRRRAAELLERIGLGRYVHHRPTQLSGGQQQRVAIARALINRPRLVLADEPTGNLDTVVSAEIMRILADLNREQGITLVLVTHEPDIARYARRLVHFLDGRIAGDDSSAGPAAKTAS